ncbi:UNVERIFIED_CONTAM: putative pumilio16 [Sesamum calycinum]|uniref:Pumilio16 n=1 Tax=Sesamum calycinum TaxID=2727403 RepID=A0AAW2QYF6_9LAMI
MEDRIPITTTTSKKTVPCVLGQDNSATKDNIWGCPRFFMTTSPGEKDVINDQNLMDRQQRSNHLVHHFRRRPLPVPFPIPIRPPIQGGRAPFLQARPLDVNHLEEIMEGDDREQKETLVSILLHYNIFMLLLNKRLHCIYCMLVDACEGQQLDLLVVRVLSQGEYFLRAAFDQQGASSIVKLIRKVKKSSPHAMAMTRVLSNRFVDIMTHPTARDVILQCLLHFPTQPNEVLYEKAILHFQDLATHEVGCRSLNDCIAVIGGDQRVRLLNQIADVSDFLSYDPYGNYVVQNVLGLKDGDITSKITIAWKMSLYDWRDSKRPGAAFRLARNQFGNYVIQTALKKTKERGFSSFYDAIVRRLEPRRRALRRTAGGKNVLSIMEADDQ